MAPRHRVLALILLSIFSLSLQYAGKLAVAYESSNGTETRAVRMITNIQVDFSHAKWRHSLRMKYLTPAIINFVGFQWYCKVVKFIYRAG